MNNKDIRINTLSKDKAKGIIYSDNDYKFFRSLSYNYNFDKVPTVISDTGRYGINNKLNNMSKYSHFDGSGVNDMFVGGIYIRSFKKWYDILIDTGDPTSPNTWKWRSSTDGTNYSDYSLSGVIIPNVDNVDIFLIFHPNYNILAIH